MELLTFNMNLSEVFMKLLFLLLLLISCNKEDVRNTYESKKISHQHMCDGESLYTQSNGVKVYKFESLTDEIGVYKRYRYYKLRNSDSCIKQEVELSYFDKEIRKRARLGIKCQPQHIINEEIFLKAANNYYEYRNDRYFLHLNPFTGEYRRIIFGEDDKGNKLHSKELGCFYMREDLENEPWEAVDYGIQLLLDRPKAAGSDVSQPNEIFRVTKMDNDWHLTRFDQVSDWQYNFCPYRKIPWGNCDLLRNGNVLFESKLTIAQKDQLLTEALLIRTQFNFLKFSELQFEAKWEYALNYDNEEPQMDFKYTVSHFPDGPLYTEYAWKEYIMGDRPVMPDMNLIQQRPVCYNGFKQVILDDGSTSHIRGEICYVDGAYEFTQF